MVATAYKILTADQWATWQHGDLFDGAPVDRADGFIHLSTGDQLPGTLDAHFSGQSGLVIVEIDLAVLGTSLRWEISRGGDAFPHVYGPIPLGAVRSVQPAEQP